MAHTFNGATLALAAMLMAAGLSARPVGAQSSGEGWELPTAPFFFNYRSTTMDSSWLSMDCEGDGGRAMRLTCRFSQILITQPTASEVRSRLAEVRATADAMEVTTLRQIGEQCRAGEGGWAAEVCACFPADVTVAAARRCFGDVAVAAEEPRARACRIQTTDFTVELDRTTRTRWVGTITGTLCDVTSALVLEAESDSYNLWTFTQTRIAVPPRDDALCAGYEVGTVSAFSWDAPELAPLTCTAIRAGF